jgi:hypothetical protein
MNVKLAGVAALTFFSVVGCRRGDEPTPSSSAPPAATNAGAVKVEARSSDGVPLDIPTTRTPAPSQTDWDAAPHVHIASAPGTGCTVKMVREWVRVDCGKRGNGSTPTGVDVKGDCTRDTYTSMKTHANAVSALARGHRCELEIAWPDAKESFTADWPSGATRPTFSFFHDVAGRPQPARR